MTAEAIGERQTETDIGGERSELSRDYFGGFFCVDCQ